MKRARFTRQELELIREMIAIAQAGQESEGDYQEWTEKSYAALDRIREKVKVRLNPATKG
jgi:hypothetical protein